MDKEKKIGRKRLERLWKEFEKVPLDSDGGMKTAFLEWPSGTHVSKICGWFDESYSEWGGVYALAYGEDVSAKIYSIILRLSFATDGDFRVRLDGLKSFIDSRLGVNTLLYDFHAGYALPRETMGTERQVVQLEVHLPYDAARIRESGKVGGSCLDLNRREWPEDAVREVLKPAVLWLFADIGIANDHHLSDYFGWEMFKPLDYGGEYSTPRAGRFKDGIMWTETIPFMSGNYSSSFAQWEFIMGDVTGDPDEWKRRREAVRKAKEEWEAMYIKQELDCDD